MLKRILILLVIFLAIASAQESVTGAGVENNIFVVTAGASRVAKLDFPIKNIAVGNPDIADVLIISRQEVLINAKKTGITNLTVWDNQQDHDYQIVVNKLAANVSFKVYKLNNIVLTNEKLEDMDKMFNVTRELYKETIDDIKNVLSNYLETNQYAVNPWNNSILVVGTPEDHKQIEALLANLDVKEKQVVFEVEIYELTEQNALTHELQLQYGKNYAVDGLDESDNNLAAVYDKSSDGLNYTFNNRIYNYAGDMAEYTTHILKILESEGKAKVLARPKIFTVNNRYAAIHAGDKTPIVKTDKQGNETVEYMYSGVIMGVIPKINENDEVNCWIATQVSSITGYSSQGYPYVSIRQNLNEARIKNNNTLIIGGLLKENENKNKYKIPLLGDLLGWVPVVGKFFNNESSDKKTTELIVSVKPIIIDEQMQPTAVSEVK